MFRGTALLLAFTIFAPLGTFAATVDYEKSLIASTPFEGNAYLTGLEVTVTAPAKADMAWRIPAKL